MNKTNPVQLVIKMIIAVLFFKTTHPVILLATFFVLVGVFVSLFIRVEDSLGIKSGGSTQKTLSQQLVTALVQVGILAVLFGLVWVFWYKKIAVLQQALL